MGELPLVVPNPRLINRLRSSDAFVSLWDQANLPTALRYRLQRSTAGNLNKGGRNGGLLAAAVPYWHPQFVNVVEPGVRRLVHAAIDGGRRISYTSCEGHRYEDGRPSSWRHVGLLPRDAAELADLRQWMLEAVRQARSVSNAVPVVAEGVLVDRDRKRPVLDLYLFGRPGASDENYFRDVDLATERLILTLRRR